MLAQVLGLDAVLQVGREYALVFLLVFFFQLSGISFCVLA
jgi:hypothetical protein